MSETKLATVQWMGRIERLDNRDLLPHRMPVDMQIFLVRLLAMGQGGALYQSEEKALRELIHVWIERLLEAQDRSRVAVFRKHAAVLLPRLSDELEHWIRQDLVARFIGYPLTHAHIKALFKEAFDELGAEALR